MSVTADDWQICKLCGSLSPVKTLGTDGCCKDVDWCIRKRHMKQSPSNGSHKVGEVQIGPQVPVEYLTQPEIKPRPLVSECYEVELKPMKQTAKKQAAKKQETKKTTVLKSSSEKKTVKKPAAKKK